MSESNTIQCPICGTPNPPDTGVCQVCGADLGGAPQQAEPPPPAEEITEETEEEQTRPQPPVWPFPEEMPTGTYTAPPPPQQQPPHIQEPPISAEDTQPREPVPVPPQPPPPGSDYDYYSDYDDEGLPTLPWRPIVAGVFVAAIALIILALLSGPGLEAPAAPNTDTPTPTDTLPPLPTDTPTSPPSETATQTTPPTETPTQTLSPTPEFCCQIVLEGDTMIDIIGRCGHKEWQAPAATAVAINDNVENADFLPPAGAEVCVPWPTGGAPAPPPEEESEEEPDAPTEGETEAPPAGETGAIPPSETGPPATEVAAEPTATSPPTETATRIALTGLDGSGEPVAMEASPTATPTLFIGTAVVEEGQTVIMKALEANTDVSMLATLNPQMDWSTCDFTDPGGGPGCNPPLRIGDVLNVPAPTYTPTLSPTPSGSETPTATPTPIAPLLLRPADGAQFAADDTIVLRWVPLHPLDGDEMYLAHVENQATGAIYERSTRLNQITLPEQARPEDGTHTFAWTILVTRSGEEADVLSGPGFQVRTFTWAN